MMPAGPILLAILAVLIMTGYFERTLSALRLRRSTAALLALGALAGSFLSVRVAPGLIANLGGTVLPLGLALHLLRRADQRREPLWAVAGALLTAGCVFLVSRWFPPDQPTELNLFGLDAQYVYGLVAALAAFVTARTPQGAFVAGSIGVILADAAYWVVHGRTGAFGAIRLGGGGFYGTAATAGILAMVLARLFGESPGAPVSSGSVDGTRTR